MRLAIFTLCLFSSLAWGYEEHQFLIAPPKEPQPWFTGPLLTPSAYVVPGGHANFEPYVYYTTNTGKYDAEWKQMRTPHVQMLQWQFLTQVGINSWSNIQITPSFTTQWNQGRTATRFNDLPIQFTVQVINKRPVNNIIPGMRAFIGETFPTGKYQKLNPHKLGTDVGGAGSFATSVGVILSNHFHLGGHFFLTLRYFGAYTYPAPVHVKGFNTYGGGYGTRGKVYPGNNISALFGMELALTQRWVLAFDLNYFYANKNRFKGHNGHVSGGAPASNTAPSSVSVSIAPAIEYNWSRNLGIIGGVWMSVTGRNATRFISGVIAVDYYL